jgi:hypothetical protein
MKNVAFRSKFRQAEGYVMVINATFNNIPVISWRSVLLVEETGIPGENHRQLTLSLNVA